MRVDLIGRAAPLAAVLDQCRRGAGGAVLVGAAGIGKTRLLSEATGRLESEGWHVERFVATEAIGQIPFGTLSALLPIDEDRSRLLPNVRRQLELRAGARRAIVAIDDAHLLDESSLACVVDLVHHTDAVVLLTVRGSALPPAFVDLWTSDSLLRVEVGPLSADETVVLAESFLAGPVSSDLASEVVVAVEGAPLLLRELLLDASTSGTIADVDGVWHLVQPLRSGPRVQEMVVARAQALDAASARLLETVALGEPIRVELLPAGTEEALDALEQQGLARVERAGDSWIVRTDHPLIGEAIGATVPTRRRTAVVRGLAARTIAAGCSCPGDALRVARWARAAGDTIGADVSIAAAREALAALDLDLAAELASAALDERPFDAHMLVGETRRMQARADEAEASLAVAATLADDDEQIVRIAMWRSTLLAYNAGQPADAIRLLEQAASSVADPVRALELWSEASLLAGLVGRFDDSIRTNRAILAHEGLDDASVWTAHINLIYAYSMLSRLDGVDEHVEAARVMVGEVEDVRPEGVDLFWALHAGIEAQRGNLVRGEREMLAHLDRCEERGELFGIAATILLQLMLLRGSPELIPTADRALRQLSASDPYLTRPLALALATLAHAAVGDLDHAVELQASIPEAALDDRRVASCAGRAGAAIAALSGGRDDGALIAAATGRRAVAGSDIVFGVFALYDAVLMGRPDLVADDIERATADVSAPLVLAVAAHAAAAGAHDPERLERVASTFEAMGARPLAAAAYADAAHAHTDAVAARRAAFRSACWARAAAPMVAPTLRLGGAVSARELDVAIEAAAGRSSREIGDRLYLSVRTVDNHLRHVYAKLGVGGRSGLVELAALGTRSPD